MNAGLILATFLVPQLPSGAVAVQKVILAAENEAVASKFAEDYLKAVRMIEEAHVNPSERPRMVRWGVEGLYAGLGEAVPKAIADRLRSLDKAGREEMLGVLRDARSRLGRRDELVADNAVYLSLNAAFARMEWGIEPAVRTEYIRSQECGHVCFIGANFVRVEGIGVKLKTDPVTRALWVVTPILHGPAYKAGLRGGDLITHISLDGETAGERRRISTQGMTVEQAEELLNGPEGTRVTLSVIPADRPVKQ
jgi:hypothetical protein